jgi:hypothetical protein
MPKVHTPSREDTLSVMERIDTKISRENFMLEYLRNSNLEVCRCYCGQYMCKGWAMVARSAVEQHNRIYGTPK